MNTRSSKDPGRFTSGISEYSPFNIVVLDTEMRILWVNAIVAAFCGTPGERWVGRRLGEMLPGLEIDRVEPMLRHILETGESITDVEQRGPLAPGSQSNRVWGCSGFRVEEPDGEIIGVALIASDVTERSQDRERLALLNEASEMIGSTLDITRTAEETLDVLVPGIGDVATVNLLGYVLDGGPQPRFEQGAGSVRMEIAAVRWFPGQPVPADLAKGGISYLEASTTYYQWLSAGRAIFEPRMSDPSPEFIEMMRGSEFLRCRVDAAQQGGVHSGMIVPISARGVILGTVGILRARQPAFTTQDLALARDVLGRSAMCIDNARVYSRERATALELQRSMLPQSISETPGIELAYRYEPANMASEIGGDWFDVVHQPDGRVAVIVGDVTGHDIHAASLMGQIRTVTRTLAMLGLSPVDVLTQLDAMVADMGVEVGATCVYATLEPDSGHCVIARAGHPPPAVVLPAGGVEFLDLPAGVPLGVGGGEFESVELSLEPSSILVFYTDGLIESREHAIDVGMDKLAQALATPSDEPFGPEYVSTLINRLVADPADDIVLLLARVVESGA
jgi:PAS domain S-box-containing protein